MVYQIPQSLDNFLAVNLKNDVMRPQKTQGNYIRRI